MVVGCVTVPPAIEQQTLRNLLKGSCGVSPDQPEPQIPIFNEDLAKAAHGQQSTAASRRGRGKNRRPVTQRRPEFFRWKRGKEAVRSVRVVVVEGRVDDHQPRIRRNRLRSSAKTIAQKDVVAI